MLIVVALSVNVPNGCLLSNGLVGQERRADVFIEVPEALDEFPEQGDSRCASSTGGETSKPMGDRAEIKVFPVPLPRNCGRCGGSSCCKCTDAPLTTLICRNAAGNVAFLRPLWSHWGRGLTATRATAVCRARVARYICPQNSRKMFSLCW